MDGLPCEILEHVYCFLNFCDYLRATEISSVGLQEMFVKCFRIKHLTLRGCPGVNDGVIKMMVEKLPDLEHLDVSESSEITLNSIRYIITGLRCLTKLRMDNCRRILVQWRFAPQYINNVQCLRLYHDTYPEFFYYNLPTVNSEPPKSNNYIYFDSNDDSSDLDELHF
ncbi:uncharacterized protein LOC129732735 isoform X6 [Wyeomyia smithii]|uniref:uncharacterized protein LOC129732735 isoform X6 n=1 Tax=Wyeomyia smithii TaxID=174621 RepID=UPI002467F1C2|nr:uncharacterized protein LOC129732735 isoform X6 [Wyeomyia smithii]